MFYPNLHIQCIGHIKGCYLLQNFLLIFCGDLVNMQLKEFILCWSELKLFLLSVLILISFNYIYN